VEEEEEEEEEEEGEGEEGDDDDGDDNNNNNNNNLHGVLRLHDILILEEGVLWDVNAVSSGNYQCTVDRHFTPYVITGSVASNLTVRLSGIVNHVLWFIHNLQFND
jgi:hypothetical protein